MKRIAFLLLTVAATIMSAQAQPLRITKHDGSQIFFTNSLSYQPQLRDGKPVWLFWGEARDEHGASLLDENGVPLSYEVRFSVADVDEIKLIQADEEKEGQRQALMEFYRQMNGDNWICRDNWGTDKPVNEWYGNQYNEKLINHLYLNDNNLQGPFPSSMEQMPFLSSLWLHGNKIAGELPAYLTNMYDLKIISLGNNQLSGNIPEQLAELPMLRNLILAGNNYSGPFPERILLKLLDRKLHEGVSVSFNFRDNDFSGKVPDAIKNHPAFKDEWPGILIQRGHVDLSDVTLQAPTFQCTDLNGNTFNLADVYRSHKYTLLYDWGWWCPWSELLNQRLLPAYKGYKDKGFEVIAINDTQDEGLESFVKENNIPWVNVRGDIGHNYHGSVLSFDHTPYYYLVDEHGNIVYTSEMDANGNNMSENLDYRNGLFAYLEGVLGKVDYSGYTSTDYSKDGEVMTLQTATLGQGVDIVFVGEGFVDKDMESGGKYEQTMQEAMEQFFAFEPFTSLRNRFNVYAVKAVSANAEFVEGATHAIDNDDSKAFAYARKVTTLIPDRPLHINVIYSSFGGRSVTYMYDDNSYVAYMMDGVSMVLNHEAGGHGIGRLLDEYVDAENANLTLPEEKKAEIDAIWASNGRGANVDWRSDPAEVKWAHLISDPRYADETLDVCEGSFLYSYGAYRPTVNSMMRYNDCPFNAPSREAIYKYVMQESESPDWTYNYETFVAFDAAGRAEFANYLYSSAANRTPAKRQGSRQLRQLTAPPVAVKGTWRDKLRMSANPGR